MARSKKPEPETQKGTPDAEPTVEMRPFRARPYHGEGGVFYAHFCSAPIILRSEFGNRLSFKAGEYIVFMEPYDNPKIAMATEIPKGAVPGKSIPARVFSAPVFVS